MSRTSTPTNEQKQAFFNAVKDGKVDKVQDMLSSNSRLLNIVTRDGATPLYVAAQEGRDQIAELLLAAGADPNKAARGDSTPLMSAAAQGYTRIVKMLISAGAYINKADHMKWTAFVFAVRYGHVQTVKLLIDAGADINHRILNGAQPITIAMMKGHDEIVKLLLDSGIQNVRHNPLLLQDLYNNTNKFSNRFYNKIIRENLRPMNPEKMCKEDIDSISLEKIASTSSSKQNRLLVWARVPRNPEASPDKIIYDCFTLDSYLDLVLKSGNRHPQTRAQLANDRVEFYYIESKATERTRFGKSKGKSKSNIKKSQRKPSKAVCTRAQKLGIRLTLKRNNKRVYKSGEMLRKQIKNAVNKRKQQKQKQKKVN